ncbi:type II secretion system protein J [Marinicella sp. W31]|uniref:PulJ/GspJ family protein n=1 Tax=Marinicella sp. W31 TaxID=3023713 RepID=UPI0037581044
MAVRRTQTGMTLLEVLLAVSLIAVIASMAFVGLNALVDARAITQEKNTELNRLNLSLQLLTQDVQMLHQASAATQVISGENQRLIVERLQYSQVSGLPSAVQRIKWEWRNSRLLRSTQDVLQPGYINRWNDRLMLELPLFSCQYEDIGGIANSSWPVTTEIGGDIPSAVVCRFGLQDGRSYEHHITPYAAMRF